MAIAEEGKTYAQVLSGKCHWIFTKDDLPEWNESQVYAVEVNADIPEIGDVWDGANFIGKPVASKEKRILVLQAAYESDLEILNKGWLSALIADGAGELDRQVALKIQMQELADQLDIDILTIIMEE